MIREAMKTTFRIRAPEADGALLEAASRDAFALLDKLEEQLSRYVAGSDIWQINQMAADETLLLSEACYDCLRIALQAQVDTAGWFDITLGTRIEHAKQKGAGAPPALVGQLVLDPERPAMHCLEAGRELDLGGIGKGFALDRMEGCLREWGIGCGLLSAGASTHLAFGSRAWTIDVGGERASTRLILRDQALSASGTGIQGAHIVSPGAGVSAPLHHTRVWVLAKTAATADAWSTAAMLARPEALCALKRPPTALICESEAGFRQWPEAGNPVFAAWL